MPLGTGDTNSRPVIDILIRRIGRAGGGTETIEDPFDIIIAIVVVAVMILIRMILLVVRVGGR